MAQDFNGARVGYGIDLDFANRYVWRGITRTNGVVFQPQASLAVLLGGGGLSTGVWANGELGNSSIEEASDFRPGVNGFGEVNYWLQYSRSTHGADWALGWLRYDFNGRVPGSALPRRSTSELYVRLQLPRVYLSPTFSVWQDVDKVRGAFLDGSIMVPVLAHPMRTPFAAVYLALTGGASLGQERKDGEAYNFLQRGVTFVDVALGTRVTLPSSAGSWRVRLEAHGQFSRDELARHVRRELRDRPHKSRFRIFLQVGWSYGRAPSGGSL